LGNGMIRGNAWFSLFQILCKLTSF
jgi:hypothetical protein